MNNETIPERRTRQYALDNFRHRVDAGRYNLMNPSEETLRVFVRWGPGESERVNFHLDANTCWDSDLRPGDQLVDLGQLFIESTWFSTEKPRVQAMLDWMQAGEDEKAPDGEFYGPNLDWFDWAWAVREIGVRGARLHREMEQLRRLRTFATREWGDLK